MANRTRYKNGFKSMGETPEMKNLVRNFERTEGMLDKPEIQRRFRR